jgi:hypothetical protein
LAILAAGGRDEAEHFHRGLLLREVAAVPDRSAEAGVRLSIEFVV